MMNGVSLVRETKVFFSEMCRHAHLLERLKRIPRTDEEPPRLPHGKGENVVFGHLQKIQVPLVASFIIIELQDWDFPPLKEDVTLTVVLFEQHSLHS